MNNKTTFAVILVALMLVPLYSEAGKKEVKGGPVIRAEKPNGNGAFQLRIRYRLPELPDNAHLDYAFLIIDQKFELPVVVDTSRGGRVRDTLEVPRGLANKGRSPIFLSVFGLDEVIANSSPPWFDGSKQKNLQTTIATLPPVGVIQQERKSGRWANEAVKVSVTQFVRSQPKRGDPTVEFIITGEESGQSDLHPSKVDVDAANLSGRLVIYYTEPPVLPPWIKK